MPVQEWREFSHFFQEFLLEPPCLHLARLHVVTHSTEEVAATIPAKGP
jgi:hypothetical protein